MTVSKLSKIELGSKDGKNQVQNISRVMIDSIRFFNMIIGKVNELIDNMERIEVKVEDVKRRIVDMERNR